MYRYGQVYNSVNFAVQRVQTPSAAIQGSFRLSVGGIATEYIPYDAGNNDIKAAVIAANITSDCNVYGGGNSLDGSRYVVDFLGTYGKSQFGSAGFGLIW